MVLNEEPVVSGNSAVSSPSSLYRRRRRPPDGNQRYATFAVVSQRPLSGTIIAEPIMLHVSLMLSRPYKRRGN